MDRFIIRKIRNLKQVRPDSSWLASQKSFLLSEISRGPEQKREPSLFLKPSFALALGIIVLITSLGTVGIISASQNSLPGDFLYPVKTAFEQTQMTFTSGEANKTELSIKIASHRMDEFTQLMDKPEKKEDIEKTVQKFTEQIVSVQENIDKLKQKNSEKAAEVAELIKAQLIAYEQTLIQTREQMAENESIKEKINQALQALGTLEPTLKPQKGSGSGSSSSEEILVPAEDIEKKVTPSVNFEDFQPSVDHPQGDNPELEE